MKRILFPVLLSSLSLSLVACGQGTPTPAAQVTPAPLAPEAAAGEGGPAVESVPEIPGQAAGAGMEDPDALEKQIDDLKAQETALELQIQEDRIAQEREALE